MLLFPPLLVFPEATLTNNSCLISFKAGAFSAGLPVQPMVLNYVFRNCDPTWVFDSTLDIFLQLYHIACQFRNVLQVSYLDVHVPTEEERNDPTLFARHVRAEMAKALGVGTSPHAFEDKLLFEQCARVGVVPNFAIARLKAALRSPSSSSSASFFREDQFREYVSVFSALDSNHDGLIDEETDRVVAEILGTHLFQAMCLSNAQRGGGGGDRERDQPSNGITFLDFVVAVSLSSTETEAYQAKELETASGPVDREAFAARVVDLCFAVFDEDKDGKVTFRDLLSACEKQLLVVGSDSPPGSPPSSSASWSSNGGGGDQHDSSAPSVPVPEQSGATSWLTSLQSWLTSQVTTEEEEEEEGSGAFYYRGEEGDEDEAFAKLIRSRPDLVKLSSQTLFHRLKSAANTTSLPRGKKDKKKRSRK